MVDVSLHVDVAAAPTVVFEAMTDWDHQDAWMLGTTVRAAQREGRGVGGTIEAYSGRRPLGFLDTMTITAWDPPHRCAVTHTGRVVRGTGLFEVRDLGHGRSRFVWSEQLELPLGVLGRIGWVLLRPLFLGGVRLSLRRFARWTEQRPATPPIH